MLHQRATVKCSEGPETRADHSIVTFSYLAHIHINQDPSVVTQPNISKVCRRMRKESLDVFYGRNKFLLDLRGWKSSSYPYCWTPPIIFEKWIGALGDQNAARMKNLSFISHNFRAIINVSNDLPFSLNLKFRKSCTEAELADGVPHHYTFDIAARRAERGLRGVLDRIEADHKDGSSLSAINVGEICLAVDNIQPFLCKRLNLGWHGAVLLKDDVDMQQWPNTRTHLLKCDDCGYHRYTRHTRTESPMSRERR